MKRDPALVALSHDHHQALRVAQKLPASTISTRRSGRVGMAEVPMPYAKNFESAALPNEDKILNAALGTLG